MISPTNGRIVWYHPSEGDRVTLTQQDHQPLSAMVVHAWSDTCVNLVVFDSYGTPHGRTSVRLHQDDGPCASSPYCEWMPFQKGQAKKHDAEAKAS